MSTVPCLAFIEQIDLNETIDLVPIYFQINFGLVHFFVNELDTRAQWTNDFVSNIKLHTIIYFAFPYKNTSIVEKEFDELCNNLVYILLQPQLIFLTPLQFQSSTLPSLIPHTQNERGVFKQLCVSIATLFLSSTLPFYRLIFI